jgi:hypothetical protein
MKTAGASQEELQNAVMQLSKEMEQGINNLGDVTEVTAKTVDRITQAAYEKVSETNKQVNAAYEEMKKPSTIKEQFGKSQSTGSRMALRDSYTSRTNRTRTNQMLQTLEPGRFPTQQAGLFTMEAAQQAGFKDAEAIRKIYQQLDITARKEVDKLVKNTRAMSEQVKVQAEKAGIDIGLFTIKGISKGVKSSSPSKETIEIGKNVAKGLEIGMQQGKSGVTRAGNQLRDAAVTSSGLIIPGGAVGSGALASGGAGGIVPPKTTGPGFADDENRARQQNTKAIMSGTDRLQNMNRLMMSGSFALTSLAGAGSFAGGRLGELSNNIFKVSGLLFGLQAVIQLLTDQMLAQLVAGRLAKAKQAAAFASYGTGISGRAGLLGKIGQLAVGIGRFLGPWGALTAAVAGAYFWWQKEKKKKEEELQAIEGLGNVALSSAEKIKTLGDFFGIVPQQTALERTGPFIRTDKETRSQLDALRADEGFLEDFKDDISALAAATNKEAELVLTALAVQLKGKGFASEQIDLIIKALQEEAGKTSFAINFKDIDVSTKEGRKNVIKSVNQITKTFGKEFEKGFTQETVEVWNIAGEKVQKVVDDISEDLQKSISTTSKSFVALFNGLSGQFESGIINADQFTKSFDNISDVISKMPEPQGMLLLENVLKNLPGDLGKSALGLQNVADKMLIVQAAALGITSITPAMLNALKAATDSAEAGAIRAANRVRRIIKDNVAIAKEVQQLLIDALDEGDGGAGKGKKELSDFDKKIQETLERLKSLRDAGINAAGGFPELIRVLGRSGTGLDKFRGIAQQMLNMGKVGLNREFIDYVTSLDQKSQKAFISINNGVVKLTKAGRALNKSFNEITLGDISKSYREQTKDLRAQVVAFHKLRAAGVSTADALKMVENAQWAVAMSSAANSEELKKLIRQYNRYKKAVEEFESLDPEAVFNNNFDDAMEYFDLLEEQARLELEPQIEIKQDVVDKIQDEIEKIQDVIEEKQEEISDIQREIELNYDRPIEALQREANLLSNDLTLLDKAANEINERYDKQAEALNKISEINQDIIAQEKSRISLADALTKGDISAAAQAMQEVRQTQATARQNSATDALQRSRENEINNLRSSSGMTRQQIEDRQFAIGQETFRLEQSKLKLTDQIRKIEDEIYDIQENQLEPAEERLKIAQKDLEVVEKELETRLRNINTQRREWEKLKNEFELSKKNGKDYNKMLEDMKNQTAEMKQNIEDARKELDKIKDKKVKVTVYKECIVDPSCCECEDHKGGSKDKNKKQVPPTTTTEDSEGEDDDEGFIPVIPPGIPSGPGINAVPQVPGQIPGQIPGQTPGSAPGAQSSSASQVGSQNTGLLSQSAAATASETKAGSLVLRADTRLAVPKNPPRIVPKNTKAPTVKTTTVKPAINITPKPTTTFSPQVMERSKGQINSQIKINPRGSVAPKSSGPTSTSLLPPGGGRSGGARGGVPVGVIGGGGLLGFQLYAKGGLVRVPPAEPPPAQMLNKGGKVKYMPMGGLVPYMNMGGIFKPKGTDTVPAMLTPGEFVIRKYAVKDFGLDKLKAINEGTYSDGSVYNYNLNLNVKSESNPDQIAETVIAQIKRIDGQRIRGNRQ